MALKDLDPNYYLISKSSSKSMISLLTVTSLGAGLDPRDVGKDGMRTPVITCRRRSVLLESGPGGHRPSYSRTKFHEVLDPLTADPPRLNPIRHITRGFANMRSSGDFYSLPWLTRPRYLDAQVLVPGLLGPRSPTWGLRTFIHRGPLLILFIYTGGGDVW